MRISVSPPRQTTASGTHARGHGKACARTRSPPLAPPPAAVNVSNHTTNAPVANPSRPGPRALGSSQAGHPIVASLATMLRWPRVHADVDQPRFSEHPCRAPTSAGSVKLGRVARRCYPWSAGGVGSRAAHTEISHEAAAMPVPAAVTAGGGERTMKTSNMHFAPLGCR